jgi:hypothetical protein
MVPVSLLRSAARSASSLSRFQCTTMKSSGIAVTNRYLTVSSSSTSGSSTGIGNIGSIAPTDMPNTSPVSNSKDPSQTPPPTASEYVYVHPLSQIVLQHLQSEECHEWMKQAGLDRNLTVHRDGTFSLESHASTTTTTETLDASNNTNHAGANVRIWTAYCPDEKKHWLTYSSSTVDDDDHSSSSASDADVDNDNDNSPAASTAQEATVEATATRVRHRFLLQDNAQTAWNNDKTSLPVRVQEFVSELMLVTVKQTR